MEEVPGLASFDRLLDVLSEALNRDTHTQPRIVFNDQYGGRRNAMGTIIAYLLLMHEGVTSLRGIGRWDVVTGIKICEWE